MQCIHALRLEAAKQHECFAHDQRKPCTTPQHSSLICTTLGSCMSAHALQPQQAAAGHYQSPCLAQCRSYSRHAAAPWHIDRWLAHLHHPKLSSEVCVSWCSGTGPNICMHGCVLHTCAAVGANNVTPLNNGHCRLHYQPTTWASLVGAGVASSSAAAQTLCCIQWQ